MGVKLLAGMGSGALGAGIANPADLLKVRMQAVGANLTLRQQVRAVVAERGILGLYRAVGPTVFRQVWIKSSHQTALTASFPCAEQAFLPQLRWARACIDLSI